MDNCGLVFKDKQRTYILLKNDSIKTWIWKRVLLDIQAKIKAFFKHNYLFQIKIKILFQKVVYNKSILGGDRLKTR